MLLGSLFFPARLGFESRQPSHDLTASYPYSPVEDRYNIYPHSLRNMGEKKAQSVRHACRGAVFSIFQVFFFSDELCASIMRSHRETSQYRMEELQALQWKLFSREEIQAYQSKVCTVPGSRSFASQTSCLICVTLSRAIAKQNMSSRRVAANVVCDSSKRNLRKVVSSFFPLLFFLYL